MRRFVAFALFALIAVAAPAKMIDKDHRYAVTFRQSAGDDERVTFVIRVTDKVTGEVVTIPTLVASPEQEAQTSVSGRSASFVVTALAHRDGRAVVWLKVMRGGRMVESSMTPYVPSAHLPADVATGFENEEVREALRKLREAGFLHP
jgi:hypothetical protein